MMKKSSMRARTGTQKNSIEMKARVKVDGSGTSTKSNMKMYVKMKWKAAM